MSRHPQARRTHRLNQFLKTESAGGLIMLFAGLLGFLCANAPFSDAYVHFIHLPFTVGYGDAPLVWPLEHWVKDVLMVFFFFAIGLELKREWMDGILTDRRQAVLPLCAAIGGMALPAAVYAMLNLGEGGDMRGWAIPMATDIAFALAILLIAVPRVPLALKVFLLAIAIFDDLGAILVIALFYSDGLHLLPLLLGGLGAGVLVVLNRCNVMALMPYLLVGVWLWFCLHAGGVHTTIGGVILGLAIPLQDPEKPSRSPLNYCLHALHPWVHFLILPLFAFTAAGVDVRNLSMQEALSPVTLGAALGLFLGKQWGIFGGTWLALRLRLAGMPQGTNYRQLYAVALLSGIGFTMSLFVTTLAFGGAALADHARLGVLAGSLLSALAGAWMLRLACPHSRHTSGKATAGA